MALHYSSSPSSEQSRSEVRRYRVREKIFSIRDQFKIKDERGNDVFIAKSKFLSFGDNLILEDTSRNDSINIWQEVFNLHPTYHITSADNRLLAQLKQNLTFFHKKFTIDSVYGQYTLEALEILAHSFTLKKEGRRVASIDKKYLSMTNTYNVEIDDKENQAFVLALVITINQILYTFHWQKLTVFR